MTQYATEAERSVRYRDLDSLGHANNAVYLNTTYSYSFP
jgi:acyl-CoA thioesterase FadM